MGIRGEGGQSPGFPVAGTLEKLHRFCREDPSLIAHTYKSFYSVNWCSHVVSPKRSTFVSCQRSKQVERFEFSNP